MELSAGLRSSLPGWKPGSSFTVFHIGSLNVFTEWKLNFPRMSDPREREKSDRQHPRPNPQSYNLILGVAYPYSVVCCRHTDDYVLMWTGIHNGVNTRKQQYLSAILHDACHNELT